MEIVVRRAISEDAELLSSLNAEVQALHAKALPSWFKPPAPQSFPPAAATGLLANPNNLLFVAEFGTTPAGYAHAEVIRQPETPWRYAYERIYVHQLGVRASHRRQGVGTALLAAVRSEAKRLGIPHLALDVWSFNADARAFFQRQGFDPYNERLWSRAGGPDDAK